MDSGFSSSPAAVAQALLGDQTPSSEGVAAAPGVASLASRVDHKHERLTSATVQTLNAQGEVAIAFTRLFAAKPTVTCTLYEAADNQPVIFKVKTWTQDGGGNYTGCTIKGYRSSILPSLSGVTLLTGLITALTNFNVFGASAAGAEFSCIALQVSS